MKTAVEVFQCVISYESRNGKEFKSEIRIRKYMRDLAKTIVLRKQIISTSIDSEYLYKHFNPNLGFARINILSKTCTCHKYFDKGICKHLIAACMLNNISLPGMTELPKKFWFYGDARMLVTGMIVDQKKISKQVRSETLRLNKRIFFIRK